METKQTKKDSEIKTKHEKIQERIKKFNNLEDEYKKSETSKD